MDKNSLNAFEKKDLPAKEYSAPELVEYGDIYRITLGDYEGGDGDGDGWNPTPVSQTR